jgi:hypothetical protein
MTDTGMPDPARAEGPASVTEPGNADRSLIVLDPLGTAKHERLPPTWDELERRHHVVWCRTPVDGALREAATALDDISAPASADIVAGGPCGGDALELANAHRGIVRAVLLVDPAAERFVEKGAAESADAAWVAENSGLIESLREAGTAVEVVAHSHEGSDDRIPAPLPLGHPEVVTAVTSALESLSTAPS